MSEDIPGWRIGSRKESTAIMAPKESTAACLSTTDIESTLQALSDVGWARLRKIARSLAHLYQIEAEDLLHEACCRALDGRRRCPSNVNLFKFLGEAMRSIASDASKAVKRHPELRLVSDSDDDENAYDPPDEQLNTEEKIIIEQEVTRKKQAILNLFEDDPVAHIMVDGIMEGMEGEELRAFTELDKTAFASKRRLIKRRIEKAFPEGRMP